MKFLILFFIIFLFGVNHVSSQSLDSVNINKTDDSGKKQGVWQKKNKNGKLIYTGAFLNNEPIDTFVYYYPNGKTIKTMLVYDNNIPKYAYVESFDKEGLKIAVGYYLNNKKDSLWKYYRYLGASRNQNIVSEDNYKDDKKNGCCKTYYTNGNLSEVLYWKNGVKHGIWEKYFDNGNIKFKTTFENGKYNGEMQCNYPDGKLLKSIIYKENLKHGTYKKYHDNGSKSEISYWKDGSMHGSRKTYNKKGQLLLIQEYDTGTLMSETKFENGIKVEVSKDTLNINNNNE